MTQNPKMAEQPFLPFDCASRESVKIKHTTVAMNTQGFGAKNSHWDKSWRAEKGWAPALKIRASSTVPTSSFTPRPSRITLSTSPNDGAHRAPGVVVSHCTVPGATPAGAALPAALDPTNRIEPTEIRTAVQKNPELSSFRM